MHLDLIGVKCKIRSDDELDRICRIFDVHEGFGFSLFGCHAVREDEFLMFISNSNTFVITKSNYSLDGSTCSDIMGQFSQTTFSQHVHGLVIHASMI